MDNQAIAKVLILFFFLAVGLYQLAYGIMKIRARNESTFFGWIRLTVGVLSLLAPIPLFYFLLRTPA